MSSTARQPAAAPGDGRTLGVLGRLLAGAPPTPGLDWPALAVLAWQQGVLALLFWRARQWKGQADGWTAIPRPLRDEMRDHFGRAALRTRRAEDELARAVAALDAGGVPAIPVKGAAVAAFYPDPALRAYGDLDLLVPEERLGAAEAALRGLGYRPTTQKDWALDHHLHLPPMIRDGALLPVEVHWRLDDPGRPGCLPVEGLWARALPWTVAGQPALRLEPVDAALHLCRHAAVQHRLHAGLRGLCDLAQATEGWGPGEWAGLVRRADDCRLRPAVHVMLGLQQEVLGLCPPPGVMEALKPRGAEALAPHPGWLLLQQPGPGTNLPMGAVRAESGGRPGGRLRGLAEALFWPRARMAAEYNVSVRSPRIWLTYLRRPLDLLRRHGGIAWLGLRGDPAVKAAWERELRVERWLERWDGDEVPLGQVREPAAERVDKSGLLW